MSAVSILMLLALLLSAPPAEAQFLNKLSKGLEKVNKNLDKVNKAIDKATKENKGKTTQESKKTSDEKAASTSSKEASDDDAFKNIKPYNQINYPYITPETRFLKVSNAYERNISDVHGGIFSVQDKDRFSFWTVDGECLFGYEWKYPGISSIDEPHPRFSSGVAVVKGANKNKVGKDYLALLYKDGRVKELDPSWVEATQFVDGLAIVTQNVNFKKNYFYINVKGEKVFPGLSLYGQGNKSMRPLCDGLRAFCDTNMKWGYINAQGTVVIRPQFEAARDFSEGYAWVCSSDGTISSGYPVMLIDRKGNVIYDAGFKLRPSELVGNGKLGDVHDGIFYREISSDTYYYDTTGKELAHYEGGSGFNTGRHAFVIPKGDIVNMVDKEFNPLKEFNSDILPGHVIEEYGPRFGPVGLASYDNFGKSMVIDTDGDIVLEGWRPASVNACIDGIRMFSASGYAKVSDIRIGDTRYGGLIKPDGEVAWLFSENTIEGGSVSRLPVVLNPKDDPRKRIPETGRTITIKDVTDCPPVGPKVWSVPSYTVKVVCVPAEGGTATLSPMTKFGYGDMATVTAKANEGYALSGIETDVADIPSVKNGEPFAVTSNVTVTVNFIKEEDIDTPPYAGAFQGIKNFEITKGISDDIAVYAEISKTPNVVTPYGDKTYGYIVSMFDPCKYYTGKDLGTYVFSAPLKIIGFQHDKATGKEWLVADGGSYVFGNVKLTGNGNPLAALFLNCVFAFDGHSSPDVIPRRYRIELVDRDDKTGEVTLGTLQVFSTLKGWVAAQDPSIVKTTDGVFTKKYDAGMNPEFYEGVKLKIVSPRSDVIWYPPMKWYNDNEPTYRRIIEQMGNKYRTYTSDYQDLFGKDR